MKCKECYFVSEAGEEIYDEEGNFYGRRLIPDCELYGKCPLDDTYEEASNSNDDS